MKKVVIIGANEFQNKIITECKELGYETHVFAWQCGDIGEKTADYFYPIDIRKKEEILDKCREIKPNAVVSIASDLASITVNYVAYNLGLTCNNPKYTECCTNKYEMRKAFKEGGIKTPKFQKINDANQLKIDTFPLIVKPTDRSGSRAIALVHNKEELEKAVINAIDNSFEKYAIVEEVIYGNEYSCECISYKGKHHFLAITKKFTTGFPKCIETGHIEPSDLTEAQTKKVIKEIFKALDILHVENGASHSEFKIDENGDIRIIEIGARMGGDCIGSDLVKISTGNNFVRMVLDVGLGLEPTFAENYIPRVAVIKFVFSKDDYIKLEAMSNKYKDNLYYKSEMEDMEHEIVDSSSRYGFYIFSFNNFQEYVDRFNEFDLHFSTENDNEKEETTL